jgi:hypothetical protein
VEPVSFDRHQFESAITNLRRDVAEWRPPPPKTEAPPRVLVTPPPARDAKGPKGSN